MLAHTYASINLRNGAPNDLRTRTFIQQILFFVFNPITRRKFELSFAFVHQPESVRFWKNITLTIG